MIRRATYESRGTILLGISREEARGRLPLPPHPAPAPYLRLRQNSLRCETAAQTSLRRLSSLSEHATLRLDTSWTERWKGSKPPCTSCWTPRRFSAPSSIH